ncbi:MAG: alpha/beta hydrolase [Acidimicrobiia bacterium]|nr:alpha/beta hydrolase [Acidimicrobiia bacterium]MBP8180130.1 alpha/beta hydrolase [Acidimicrobiia bacterium]
MTVIKLPTATPEPPTQPKRAPRLARHELELPSGIRATVSVAGRGVPLVVVHGFMAEGFLYAQTLNRLVAMGFKVIAIDAGGHGGTSELPEHGYEFDAYVDQLEEVCQVLGIRRAVFAGHSMGGRLALRLAARNPDNAIAVIPISAITGQTWDDFMARAREFPVIVPWLGLLLVADSLTIFPLIKNARQARKLIKLAMPLGLRHLRGPWKMIAPMLAILRDGSSEPQLDLMREHDVPVIAVHGDKDLIVPLATARDTAERAGGQLVVVHRGLHSWLLTDPETLPAIFAELLRGPLWSSYERALRAEGINPETATANEIENAFYAPNARIRMLTPDSPTYDLAPDELIRPRYTWSRLAFEPGSTEANKRRVLQPQPVAEIARRYGPNARSEAS